MYFSYYDYYQIDMSILWVPNEIEFPKPIKVIGIIGRFIHNTHSIRKLLPLGHRWRGDVDVI